MHKGITVVIPTIPPRGPLLHRALESIRLQTLQPYDVIVTTDLDRVGAARTRQQGLDLVETEWVAFLDDDDEFMPGHLEALAAAARAHGADYVFSWYEVVGGTDPRPDEFGLPWLPSQPRQTTITTLVRTGLARQVGGFTTSEHEDLHSPDRHFAGEDWRFTSRMNDAGARIYHLPVKTWLWHHHGRNTSGLPRW
jgi:glycosyltransferase involved in cell wall biosynthesis